MKLPIMLLTLLSLQGMASTMIDTDSTNTDELQNKTIIKIQRELPLARDTRETRSIRDVRPLREIEEIFIAATTRDNREVRLVRNSRITREIHYVYASPKKLKPIQIAGLK